MDYKVELQNNNIDLGSILEAINTLPEGSGSGNNSFVYGTVTTLSDDTAVVVPDVIGKDNVLLIYSDLSDISSNRACVCNVCIYDNICGNSIAYQGEIFTTYDEGFIEYNKNTGSIGLTSTYNETFAAGKYVYAAW